MALNINLPLTEPILIFTVIILIVFLSPILLRRINIPDIVGLIVAGVLIGPYGLNILAGDIALSIFGTIGLLYLMFLAGLEIDLNDLFIQRKKGGILGLLTFIVPFIIGLWIFYFILDYRLETSLLIATMLSSHTLVSYPILGRLGIVNHKTVTVIISSTIIADTAALISLGIIADSSRGDLSLLFWLRILINFAVFFSYILYLLPLLAKWFFKYQASEKSLQYVFILTAIFTSATFAEFLEIEPLIGAFFTGLSLNRLIPRTSSLMNRIVFIGNTLFIPFFLISIGMMVNLTILISDLNNWVNISILIVIAFISKYLAAYIYKRIYKASREESQLIFGLSVAKAASAIAIMIVGQQLNLVDENLLNSTIILILISCLLSSIITQKAGKALSIKSSKQQEFRQDENEKIMVSISNPSNIGRLIDFGLLIKNPKSPEPLYPLSVVPDGDQARIRNQENKQIIKKALYHAGENDKHAELITRIDVNIAEGISRAVKELAISKLIVGWNGKTTTIEKLFGILLDKLVEKTHKMILVTKLENQVGLTGNIHIFLPSRAETEKGFIELINTIKNLSKHLSRKVTFYGSSTSLKAVSVLSKGTTFSPDIVNSDLNEFFFKKLSSTNLPPSDMLIFVKARNNTQSYSRLTQKIPKIIQKYFCYHNLILIYPEQKVYKSGMYHLYYYN